MRGTDIQREEERRWAVIGEREITAYLATWSSLSASWPSGVARYNGIGRCLLKTVCLIIPCLDDLSFCHSKL